MPYNILTCKGFIEQASTGLQFGNCFKSRIGIVFLFFILAIVRKWGGEMASLNFSFLFALILGLLPYLIVITIFGSFKVAFAIGIVGGLIGGYGGGAFFPEEGGE
jgi:hypothetical protein